MIQRIKIELSDSQCAIVATGGLSSIITPLQNQFTLVDKNLTLNGLKTVGEFVLKAG
jgi:type III pantothenate kinase